MVLILSLEHGEKQRELQLFPHLNAELRQHLYCMIGIRIVFDTISTIRGKKNDSRGREF